MRLNLILAATSAFAVLAAQATPASAGPVPTHFTDLHAFLAMATYTEAAGMSYNGPIPNPLTVASFTLTTGGHNIIYAAGSAPFLPIRDVFSSSIHSPLNGTIGDHFHQGPFDLLGFRVGNLVGPDFTDVTLNFASGATYSTVVASMPIQVGLLFHGFLAPPGEFFSGFSLSPHGIDSRVATDYFVVGTSACTGPGCGSPTPEPSGWALMIVGFGASGAALRRRRAAPAFAG